MITQFNNLLELSQTFKNEEDCVKYMEKVIWNGKPKCPHCGEEEKIYNCKHPTHPYKCSKCRKHFNIKTGTFFQHEKIGLVKWFYAIFLVSSSAKFQNGLSLAKQIGVSNVTSWYMLHRIRQALLVDMQEEKIGREVEVDETIWYGANKNKRIPNRYTGKFPTGRYLIENRYAVFGMKERRGKVIAMSVPDFGWECLREKILKHVSDQTVIYSDEYQGYNWLNNSLTYKRRFVKHSHGEYVNGSIHNNGIEGFWGQMKRTLKGVNHWVSGKHLDRYLAQCCFMMNTRDNTVWQRFNNILVISDVRITYKELIR